MDTNGEKIVFKKWSIEGEKFKRIYVCAVLYSCIFSFALVLGDSLYSTNSIEDIYATEKSLFFFIAMFIIHWFLGAFIICLMMIILELFKNNSKNSNNFQTLKILTKPKVVWGGILVSWLPVFFAFYPGICSYDSYSQTTQAMLGLSSYTKYHPPLHTLIWDLCIEIGMNIGVHPLSVYSVIQMLLLSWVLAKMVVALVLRNANRATIMFALLWVSVNPIMAIFSLVMTKDAFFAIFFIWMSLYLLELADDFTIFLKCKRKCLKLCITLLMCCLLRNNMIYACLLSLPILVFLCKHYKKRLVLLFIVTISIYFFINNYIYACMGIKEGNVRESLNVPIQQISYVVVENKELITDEEKCEIERFIPYEVILNNYNPRFADPVKFSFLSENYEIYGKEFWKLWFRLLKKYPIEYINAFFTLNLPYWYQGADPVDEFSRRDYVEINMDSGDLYPMYNESKFPAMYNVYKRIASYELIEKVPILSGLYSLSLPIWLILFSIGVLWIKNEKIKIIVLLPSLCLWVTYMAGPVSNFRYIFPIFTMYPLMMGLIGE